MAQVTEILAAARAGDPAATARLVEIVYAELHHVAANRMRHEDPGHTLQATALVHEAWLRLGAADKVPWINRAHFFAAAAEAMRRILIERARRKRTLRRGGDKTFTSLEGTEVAAELDNDRIEEISQALELFATQDPLKAELVKLRYFIGMTIPESAQVLGISEATAKRYWTYARAWLLRELKQH
jgi:RNA polymerase sigma factor (TIGR02999 family)